MMQKLKTMLIIIAFVLAGIAGFSLMSAVDNKVTSKPKQQTPPPVELTWKETVVNYFGAEKVVKKLDKILKTEDNEPEEHKTDNVLRDVTVTEIPVEKIVPSVTRYPALTNDDSPEASNHDHSWLINMVESKAYPDIKAHVREAFENDGVLRKTENTEIIQRSVDWNELQDAGEKKLLRDMVQ